jgi:hypothetical protein
VVGCLEFAIFVIGDDIEGASVTKAIVFFRIGVQPNRFITGRVCLKVF